MSLSAHRNNRCIPSGDRSPACSAKVQPFLRSSPATSPDIYCKARRRASNLVNRPAKRA
ncbi:hypothetical protein J3R03_003140 [Actinoplanes couchii]|nr:hypothetical protein [Actinoplanes couchii]